MLLVGLSRSDLADPKREKYHAVSCLKAPCRFHMIPYGMIPFFEQGACVTVLQYVAIECSTCTSLLLLLRSGCVWKKSDATT